MFDIQKYLDNMKEARKLRCPHCTHEIADEMFYDHVSYWGSDDGPKHCECPSCGREFLVKEIVTRTFETSKIGEDEKNAK